MTLGHDESLEYYEENSSLAIKGLGAHLNLSHLS